MMRYLRGTVLLGVSALLWACNTESGPVEGGTPEQLFTDPQSMFIDQGDVKTILVRVLDQQGSALNEPITISNVGAGISVEGDSAFRPIYNANGELVFNNFNNELRLFVTGNSLTSTSFDVSGASFTETVSVIVLPDPLAATLSTDVADVGEPVILTAPAGFTFNPNSEITFAGADEPAQIVSVAADGTTITFLPVPGSNNALLTVSNVTPGYAPALSIPFETPTTVRLTTTTLLSSPDPNTAPTLPVPAAIGDELVYNDINTGTDQFWHFEITEANTTLAIAFDWQGSADMDFWFCDAACTTAGDPGGFGGASSDHPEEHEITFVTPGIYTLQANNYDGGNAGSFVRITLERVAASE
ncbi:MAG TPA: hypothetical protein VFS94_09120 [Gemmatimonadales bacterium]|nr:hypothetical protein [Gemmatimonadales bacterium]